MGSIGNRPGPGSVSTLPSLKNLQVSQGARFCSSLMIYISERRFCLGVASAMKDIAGAFSTHIRHPYFALSSQDGTDACEPDNMAHRSFRFHRVLDEIDPTEPEDVVSSANAIAMLIQHAERRYFLRRRRILLPMQVRSASFSESCLCPEELQHRAEHSPP